MDWSFKFTFCVYFIAYTLSSFCSLFWKIRIKDRARFRIITRKNKIVNNVDHIAAAELFIRNTRIVHVKIKPSLVLAII